MCDTSFLKHFEKSRHRPGKYETWDRATLNRVGSAILAITPFTLAEVRYGYSVASLGPARVAAIENQLRTFLLIPIDERVLDTYVSLKVDCHRAGRGIGFHDCWIAATALSQGLPLVTCDKDQRDLPSGPETIYFPVPDARV